MEQSPSWEANQSSGSQEIPHIFNGTRRLITAFTKTRHLSLSGSQEPATCPCPDHKNPPPVPVRITRTRHLSLFGSQEPATCPYPDHKNPPPVLIRSHSNPVHASPSHFLKIHFNITLSSTPRSSKWSILIRYPNQNPLRTSIVPKKRHKPHPSHSSRFHHPNKIWWGVQIIKFHVT